jgi:hypothetical protein
MLLPLQGAKCGVIEYTQGVALGWVLHAPSGRSLPSGLVLLLAKLELELVFEEAERI